MSRIPRPFPVVTPNDLLSGSTLNDTSSRPPSTTSVTSVTRLLSQPQIQPYSPPTGRVPSRSASVHSHISVDAWNNVPKRLFVVNADATPASEEDITRAARGQQVRRGASYGAMGSPAHPRPMDLISFSPAPSVHSKYGLPGTPRVVSPPASAATFGQWPSAAAPMTPRQMEEGNAGAPQRPLLLSANPFMDPPSRDQTPESFHSGYSMSSAPTNSSSASSYTPFGRTYGGYLSPHTSYSSNGSLVGVPPQLQPGANSYPRFTDPFNPSRGRGASKSSIVSHPGTPMGTPAALTPSSASVHSVVPSVHLLDARSAIQPQYAMQVGIAQPSVPPTAHMRAPSDDMLWRPYSAGPRMSRSPNDMLYEDVRLPNPYGGEVRRFGSVPHVRSGRYSGGYGAAGYGPYSWGAADAGQAEEMRTPSRGIARGAVVAQAPNWREMVMRAATG